MRIVFVLALIIFYTLPLIVLAQNTIDQILQNAKDFLWTIGSAIIVIMMIWTGILYLTSLSNPKRMEMAKLSLIYTIIGVVLLVLSFSAYNIIKQFLGV